MLLNLFKVDGQLAPRRVLASISVVSLGLLAFGLYLQHYEGLNSVPDVYRAAVCSYFGSSIRWSDGDERQKIHPVQGTLLTLLMAGFGAYTAANQAGCSGSRPRWPPAAATSTA